MIKAMRTFMASLLAATTMVAAATAEARCKPAEVRGTYSVQVSGFQYDRGYGCELNEQGCGTFLSFVSTCTFRVTRNSFRVMNLRIRCDRSMPSDWSERPFNVECIDGCPHHQLHAVGRHCDWDLVDLNGDIFFGSITYRVTFSADRQLVIGAGAAGTHSDVDHDGRDGVVASFVGVRR